MRIHAWVRFLSTDLFATRPFLLLLSACWFGVCLVAKHKKLVESNSFFEMQMELECLSTVPVALMGQSVEYSMGM